MDNPAPVLSRRLSGVDAAFLYLERKEIPLNIACVALFDGPIPFREFMANIESRLDMIPRYRQVAVPPPFNLGYPTWEYDPDFDIKHHIFKLRLEAPGGEAELEALAGRLLSQVLDRTKPLWEIHLVEGLRNGRGALIARIHHALADGVAGAALLRIMLDPTPEGSHALRRPGPGGSPRGAPKGPASKRTEYSLAEQVGGAIQSALENAVAAEAGLLSLAEGLLSDQGKTALQDLATLLPEWLQPPERFPFNKPCSGDRKFVWAEADFEDVRAIRAAVGGKVNDCILSVVVRAIGRYIRLHGEPLKGRFLRVVCPVNLRAGEQGESLGNRITFLPVVLPLDVRGPVDMLQAVASRMEIMKSVHAAELLSIFASCLGTTPAPVQELFWRGIPLVPLPLPLLNLICTNVPGSPTPLYTVGRKMLASYPHVPTGYELGVGVAVQSYDGKLCFGLTADAHVAPDVTRLRDYIRECFEELAKAAGIRGRRPRAGKAPADKAKSRPKKVPRAAAGAGKPATEKPRAPVRRKVAHPAESESPVEVPLADPRADSPGGAGLSLRGASAPPASQPPPPADKPPASVRRKVSRAAESVATPTPPQESAAEVPAADPRADSPGGAGLSLRGASAPPASQPPPPAEKPRVSVRRKVARAAESIATPSPSPESAAAVQAADTRGDSPGGAGLSLRGASAPPAHTRAAAKHPPASQPAPPAGKPLRSPEKLPHGKTQAAAEKPLSRKGEPASPADESADKDEAGWEEPVLV